MTCRDLFITYVYVRSAYLISRQLPQKGELSDFKLLTLGLFLSCVSLFFYICSCAILFFHSCSSPQTKNRDVSYDENETRWPPPNAG